MTVASNSRRGWPLLAAASAAFTVLGSGAAYASIEPFSGASLDLDPAAWIEFHHWLRGRLELSVMVLQLAAVATLGLLRLTTNFHWANLGRRGFAASMLGLGVLGTSCAGYGSDFALFAGATMGVLLIVSILGPGHVTAARSA